MALKSQQYSLSAIIVLALLWSATRAFAADIQMLPPVTFDGTNKTPCSAATGGLLFWDGQTAIKCVPGSSGDASGDLTVGGNVTVGTSSALQTGYADPGQTTCSGNEGGKIRFNTSTNIMEYCNGSSWVSFSFPSHAFMGATYVSDDASGIYPPGNCDTPNPNTNACSCPSWAPVDKTTASNYIDNAANGGGEWYQYTHSCFTQ